MEHNPYFWWVDTEGRQLPYIDRVTFELVTDREVINLKASAELDFQFRHLSPTNLTLFKENEERCSCSAPTAWAASIRCSTTASRSPDSSGWPRPTSCWRLLKEAQNVQTVGINPWLILPVFAVIVTVLACNFLGDGLRDAADPYR